MYLVDTDVVGNARKRTRADPSVRQFFGDAVAQSIPLQIAATALMYGLTVVTRNVPHYEPTGVAVLNPFT